MMKRINAGFLLFAISTATVGCASPQVDLVVDVRNRSTKAPVEGAVVTAYYIPPMLFPRSTPTTGRTRSNGEIVLKILKKEYPLVIRISDQGTEEHEIPTYIDRIISNPQWCSPPTVTMERGTLDVRLRVLSSEATDH